MRTGCHDDRDGQARRWYPLEHGAVGDFDLSVADGVAEAVAGAPWTKVRPRINHVAMHLLVPHLPFGGVGPSGMGAHHGEWGFQTMSHRKAVLAKTTKPDLKLLYPRYTEKGLKTMRRLFCPV
jgi:hypothetical protein